MTSKVSTVYRSLRHRIRTLVIAAGLYFVVSSSLKGATVLESRYQYYQEEDGRMRVDSNYSLYSIDLSDTLVLDGSLLYTALSGASPTGLPPLTKGKQVPTVFLDDERYASTIGLTKKLGQHSVRLGFAASYESDYTSFSYSVQDTISLNQKNTELVLGFAYTDDTVSANGSILSEPKRSYDALIGLNQVLGPNDLISANVLLGWREGFLSDPYKRVLMNSFFALPEKRPDRKFEQLFTIQWTHHIEFLDASVETTYRFGHNDHGNHSHTGRIAFYKKFFGDRLVIGPSFRYYRQSAADYYDTEFSGNPQYYSADYRVSAQETFSSGVQVRWFPFNDHVALDLGYERYETHGLDHDTSQSAYPSAHSFTVGLHFQF
jgi:hypothetical protein